jgi:hypothetical protein
LDHFGPSHDSFHPVCGSCGMRKINGQFGEYCRIVCLSELPEIFLLDESETSAYNAAKIKPPLVLPVDEHGATREFHLYKLRSVYESKLSGRLYHIHPECVHQKNDCNGCTREYTVLCESC